MNPNFKFVGYIYFFIFFNLKANPKLSLTQCDLEDSSVEFQTVKLVSRIKNCENQNIISPYDLKIDNPTLNALANLDNTMFSDSLANSFTKFSPISRINSFPIAEGTFIQDYLVASWDDKRWQKEFSMLKEIGMTYLIFAPTLHSSVENVSQTIYTSSLENVTPKYKTDLVEMCLRNAEKSGFKVFIGLNFHEHWWDPSFTNSWFIQQIEIGNRLAHDLTHEYKSRYPNAMHGWYWIWEIDNLNFKTRERQEMLIKGMNLTIDNLTMHTPDMPFMFSPFVNYRVGEADENAKMWKYILGNVNFREGDIFAPQDSVGAGGMEMEMLQEWLDKLSQAVDLVNGLEFWSNVEVFEHQFWTSAPLNRFIEQMEIADPYVDRIITFAYSHYYSPYVKIKNFHEDYKEYVNSGLLPIIANPQPVRNLKLSCSINGNITLKWKHPINRTDVVGYHVYKNGSLVANLQRNHRGFILNSFKDTVNNSINDYYQVRTYTSTGNMSTSVGGYYREY